MATENSRQQTKDSILGCIKTVSLMEKDFTNGLMAARILATIYMTRKRDLEYTHGRMVNSIKDFGQMDSRTASDVLQTQKDNHASVDGRTASEWNGLRIKTRKQP